MDIIASMSPDIELLDIGLGDSTIAFSLPLSRGEHVRFEGRVTPDSLIGEAVYQGRAEVRGVFKLTPVLLESLPGWARGEGTLDWPGTDRPYWPTRDWNRISPVDAGMDGEALAVASEALREGFPSLRALLVVRGSDLAFEEYYHGGGPDEAINIKSVSKGIITALVGIAVRKGRIESSDKKLSELVPEYFEDVSDSRKKEIRLHHLLDMTAGLHWAENGEETVTWYRKGHSSAYYLSLPLDCAPGECFIYATGSTHLVSEILSRETGMTTRAFAEKFIFGHVGIEISDWWQSSSGVHIGGADILMTARDMARIGLLFLSRGVWDGREIIPAEWVSECVDYRSEGQPFVGSYGYGWWRREISGRPAFLGKGYGGQFIIVVPDSDLVVVVGSDISSQQTSPLLEHTVCESIVPAALSGK
jgi:CubicO group peptidase (beta-lactamase class C family)